MTIVSCLVAVLTMLAMVAGSSGAAPSSATCAAPDNPGKTVARFEIDGNLFSSSPSSQDWFGTGATGVMNAATCRPANGQTLLLSDGIGTEGTLDSTVFLGAGNHLNDQLVPLGTRHGRPDPWSYGTGKLLPQYDIGDVYATARTVLDPFDPGFASTFIIVGISNAEGSVSKHYDIEINAYGLRFSRGRVFGGVGSEVTGGRQPGDLLITIDSDPGRVPSVRVFQWGAKASLGGAYGYGGDGDTVALHPAHSSRSILTYACMNADSAVTSPCASRLRLRGAGRKGPPYGRLQFLEAAIQIDGMIPQRPCGATSSLTVGTRSGASITSALQDFVTVPINTSGPCSTLAPGTPFAVIPPGEPIIPASDDPSSGTDRGDAVAVASGIEIDDPAPNPFHGEMRLRFAIHDGSKPLDLRVYDVAGRLVRTLTSGVQSEGEHVVRWDGLADDGRRAGKGVYFIHAVARDHPRVIRIAYLQ